jgi:uncharacterized protein (DUF39 family)
MKYAMKKRRRLVGQRISMLGNLAKVQEQVTQKQNEINRANLDGAGISRELSAEILNATRVAAEGAQLQVRAANGIVTANELMLQKQRDLDVAVKNQTFTQSEANKALENYSRHARDAADAAAIYASKLPNLKQLELDSGRLDKQLDQFASGTLTPMTGALIDIRPTKANKSK